MKELINKAEKISKLSGGNENYFVAHQDETSRIAFNRFHFKNILFTDCDGYCIGDKNTIIGNQQTHKVIYRPAYI